MFHNSKRKMKKKIVTGLFCRGFLKQHFLLPHVDIFLFKHFAIKLLDCIIMLIISWFCVCAMHWVRCGFRCAKTS